MPKYFKLNNKDEVLKFEHNLKGYYKTKSHFDILPYLDLSLWFDKCSKDYLRGGRIFTAILDIKINLLFVDLERTKAQQIWEGRSELFDNKTIIEDFGKFLVSFELLGVLSTYILKYRALLDKIMGLIVLYSSSENYDKFRRGSSRKKLFLSIYGNKKIPLNLNFQGVFDFLERFDEKLRTPEAHSTGSIRKWVLTSTNVGLEEFKLIRDSWANLIYIISEIDKMVKL